MSNEFAMADLEAGQLNALVKIIGGSDVVRQILRSEVVVTLTAKQAPAPKPPLLTLINGAIQIDGVPIFQPKVLTTRKGLWVSDDFVSQVRAKAGAIGGLDALSLCSYELARDAYDREITQGLGEKRLFSEFEVCACIEQLVSKQSNGEEGDLLNNGCANLFYLAGCVVRVRWRADRCWWFVSAWELGDVRWVAGRRAFSRN
jgi:hypothetical protein